jgi:hypothetical protein
MISKQKNPVEKPKKSVEKPKKSVEKTKKSVEKPKKSVEKTKKPVEKPKKSVEKPKKPVPKKRVKNVNVDKIINIIKKYIIKCGIKNPKLKRRGGSKISEFFVKGVKNIASAAQSLTTKKFGNIDKNECFENLKAIDGVFASIKNDVISARKELLKSLESQKTNDVSDIFNKLINKYKFINSGNDANKIYNYKYNTEIKIEFSLDDIENIEINNYLILYTIDIVAQLELYREGMLLCANYTALVDNADATQKIKEYNNKKLDLFVSDKESILNSVDSDTSATSVASSASASAVPVASVTSVASATSAVSSILPTTLLHSTPQQPTQEADLLEADDLIRTTQQNTRADAPATSVSSIPNRQSIMSSPFRLNTSTAAPMSSSVRVAAPVGVVESDAAPVEDEFADALEEQEETFSIKQPIRGRLLGKSPPSSHSSASSTITLASRRPDQRTGTPPLESVTSSRSTSSDEIMSASPQLTSSFSSISRSSPGRIQTSSPPTNLGNRNSGAPYGNEKGSTYV